MPLISVDETQCLRDGLCAAECPLMLIVQDDDGLPKSIPSGEQMCIRCGHCVAVCPVDALRLDSLPADGWTPVQPELTVSPAAAAQLLKTRRSVRVYQERAVSRETLEQVLDLTRWAPTATNRQPVKWIVLDDREKIRALAGMAADGLRAIPYFARLTADWDQGHDRIFRGAPHVVIAYAALQGFDPAADCAISLSYLDIAAHAHGLGTCWAGVLMAAIPSQPGILSFLEIPEGHRICGAMMIGYPKNEYQRIPIRNPIDVTWK